MSPTARIALREALWRLAGDVAARRGAVALGHAPGPVGYRDLVERAERDVALVVDPDNDAADAA